MRCTRCGSEWKSPPTPPPTSERSRPVFAAGPPRRSGVALGPRSPEISDDRWVQTWTLLAGLALLIGFAAPALAPRFDGFSRGSRFGSSSHVEALMFWDLMREVPGGLATLILFPLFLGIATLVLRATLRGRTLGIALTGAATLVWIVAISVLTEAVGGVFGREARGAPVVLLMMATLGTGIAAGNRLRKSLPESLTAKLLTGICASVFLLLFVIPIAGLEDPLIASVFRGREWSSAPGFPIAILLLGAYGILGTCAFQRLQAGSPLLLSTSILGRAVLAAPVVGAIIQSAVSSSRETGLPLIVNVLKGTLEIYGVFAVLGVGIVAWLAGVLGAPGAAPARASSSGAPYLRAHAAGAGAHAAGHASPDAVLAERIAALDRARTAGILTDEEYEAKRRQIVEQAQF